MGYILENKNEFKRLEKQAQQADYSLIDEFRHIDLCKNFKVLDAGCGSGLVSRFMLDQEPSLKITAIDSSDIRIAQAKKVSSHIYSNINYLTADLGELPFEDNSFDIIVSRYVYEYLQEPIKITNELKRVLKKGGKVYLIDLDGVFLNFWTAKDELNSTLKKISENVKVDLYVGRKLPSFLHKAGFQSINWDLSAHKFNTPKVVEEEKFNNGERLKFAESQLVEILESKEKFDHFSNQYLEEMSNFSHNTLFFNKFIAWGTKG